MNIKEAIAGIKNIVITTHQSPDGDAIGSSLAMYNYLQKKGHNVKVIIPDAAPVFLQWLTGADTMVVFEHDREQAVELVQNADVVFSLDYNDLKRVGDLGIEIEKSNAYLVMIDHHLNPVDFANHTMSDITSCSTAQLIYDFIEEQSDLDLIDETIAEGIYCGIITDSGSFRFPSVLPKTHLIAADLINRGLNHSRVHELLYDVNTLDRLKLLGYSLHEKLRVLPNLPVAVITLSEEDAIRFNVKKGDTDTLVNYALSVDGVKMSAFIREDKEKVKMSFRSKGDVPVNEFSAMHFNGGGHKNAAGGVSYTSFVDTIKLFEEKVAQFIV